MINNIETPCFILDKKELERSIAGFQSALADNFARSIVGYSVKTCSLPHAMIIARDNGCYAEVVSHDEFMLAKACGFPVDKIIYNGPLKSETTFIEAITQGSIVNIDTQREIEWLQRLPASRSYDVGLRLNINISKISPDDADGDNDNSRFGFSDDTGELSSALCDIFRNENIRIAGIHIHRTAHSRSVDFYKHSIEYACQIIDKYDLSPRYIDIGGGYFGIFPGKPTYAEYAAAFREVLKRYGKENLTVIVEPGNAIVASAFRFVSSVIDIKHTEENHYFVTTDGSRNDVDPFFRKSSYLYQLQRNSEASAVVAHSQTISGCTCLEYDRLFTIIDQPLLSIGDYIIYNNVGAYTMCLSPLFIRLFPNVYLLEDDTYTIIRRRWTAEKLKD